MPPVDKPDPLASLRPGDITPIPDGNSLADAFGCESVSVIIFDSNGGAHFASNVTLRNYVLHLTDRASIEALMAALGTR